MITRKSKRGLVEQSTEELDVEEVANDLGGFDIQAVGPPPMDASALLQLIEENANHIRNLPVESDSDHLTPHHLATQSVKAVATARKALATLNSSMADDAVRLALVAASLLAGAKLIFYERQLLYWKDQAEHGKRGGAISSTAERDKQWYLEYVALLAPGKQPAARTYWNFIKKKGFDRSEEGARKSYSRARKALNIT